MSESDKALYDDEYLLISSLSRSPFRILVIPFRLLVILFRILVFRCSVPPLYFVSRFVSRSVF